MHANIHGNAYIHYTWECIHPSCIGMQFIPSAAVVLAVSCFIQHEASQLQQLEANANKVKADN